ncbi:chorismate mutase [Motilimonas pumila]|nr:chorismate mutase [Motilimonas pumila]
MLSLEQIRQEITALDQALLTLLAKRKAIAIDVARSKQATTKPVRDIEREQALLIRLIKQGAELGLEATYITQIYHTILEDSVRSQQVYLQQQVNANNNSRLTLSYVADSEALHAANNFYQQRKTPISLAPAAHFQACFEQVEQGTADAAILPIESSSAGSINQVYDLLQHTQLAITGEIVCQQNHCIYSNHNVGLDQVEKIYTTPEAYSQADQCLLPYQDKIHYLSATSKGITELTKAREPVALLASDLHPGVEDLSLIKAKVNNQADSLSRYIIVAKQSIQVASQVPAKTTLVVSTGQQAGALLTVLSVFNQHQLPMTKLESRPVKGQPWQEVFYIDLAANLDDLAMQQAFAEIQPLTHHFKILGCYPSHEVAATQLPSQAYVDLSLQQSKEQDASAAQHPLSEITQHQHCVLVSLQGNDIEQLKQDCQQLKQAGSHGIVFSLEGHHDVTNMAQLLAELKHTCQQLHMPLGVAITAPVQIDAANKFAQFATLPWSDNMDTISACCNKLSIATAVKVAPDTAAASWLAQCQKLNTSGNQRLFAYINETAKVNDLNCVSELTAQGLFKLPLLDQDAITHATRCGKLGAHLELSLRRDNQGQLEVSALTNILAAIY